MIRLQHDVAWATALHILEVFSPLLRDEKKRDAFHEVYDRVKAGLLASGWFIRGAPRAFEITRMSKPFRASAENFCLFGVIR